MIISGTEGRIMILCALWDNYIRFPFGSNIHNVRLDILMGEDL